MGGCCQKGPENFEISMKQPSNPLILNNSLSNFYLHPEYHSNFHNSSSEIITTEIDKISNYQIKQTLLLNNIKKLFNETSTNKIYLINLESIWNISKYYKDDFTICDYILYDLRESHLKTENFFKKFKCVNYTINTILELKDEKINNFKKYIEKKNLIIIPNNINDLSNIKNLINFLYTQKINSIRYNIFSLVLNEEKELNIYSKIKYNLLNKLDDMNFENYPNILFPFKILNYLNNDGYIFIKEDLLDISKENLIDENIMEFLISFRINLILNINNLGEINFEIYLKGYYINFDYKQYNNKENIYKLIYLMKNSILNGGSLLIIYNENIIEKGIIEKWLSIILYNLIYIQKDEENLKQNEKILEIIKTTNPLFLSDDFLFNLSQELESIYIEKLNNFNIFNNNQNNIIYKNIENELNNLLEEINYDFNLFLEIIVVIEKIILNIINHPNIEKFYKIKKSSKSITSKILKYKNAENLFLLLGFNDCKGNDKEYFYFNMKNNINNLNSNYEFIVTKIKKLIFNNKINNII